MCDDDDGVNFTSTEGYVSIMIFNFLPWEMTYLQAWEHLSLSLR